MASLLKALGKTATFLFYMSLACVALFLPYHARNVYAVRLSEFRDQLFYVLS